MFCVDCTQTIFGPEMPHGLLVVIVAPPEEMPVQLASEMAVTEYDIVTAGLTEREAGLEATPAWFVPSDHVRFHGAVPVNAAWITADWPAQIVTLPLTVAFGRGLTVMVALPDEVPVQLKSETDVTV